MAQKSDKRGSSTRTRKSTRRRITGPLHTVGTALAVLDYLSLSPEPLGVRELGRALNIRKSTVHRILQTLSAVGFLRQDVGTDRYQLGPKILEISARFQKNLKFRRLARPYLEQLQATSGETVFLSMLDGLEAVIVDRIDSAQPLRMVSEIGSREPAHCTAIGKMLLASLSEQELDDLLTRQPLKQFTAKTIVEPNALKEELKRIATAGHAVDDEEYLWGVRCISAPMWNSYGKVVAALSVSGPSFRITRKRVPKLVEEVRSTALRISSELGFPVKTEAESTAARG